MVEIFVILVYDIGEERVNTVRKKCMPYLTRIENSVFIGEITNSKLKVLIDQLSSIIDKNIDVIDIFILKDKRYVLRKILGTSKEYEDIII